MRGLVVAALAGLLACFASVLAAASLVLLPTFVAAAETVDRRGIEGEPIPLSSKDPDVSDYLRRVETLIWKNWVNPCVIDAEKGQCAPKAARLVVDFGIFREGRVAFIHVQTSSGLPTYDRVAVTAIKLASPLPPVPEALMKRMKEGSTGAAIRANFIYVYEIQAGLSQLPQKSSPASTPAGAPVAVKAGVVTALQGIATARRVGLPDPVLLKVNDSIFLQDTITTGDGGRVEMLLGGKAEVSMQERSVLTITEAPGRSSLDLANGQMSLNMPEDRMRRGEEIAVRTPNALAGIRGGRFFVAVEGGDVGVITHVDVLAGETSVTTAASAPIQVHANEGVTITGGAVGPIRPLQTR